MVPLVLAGARVGCAQARWGHLNASENLLTQALALGTDGHFGVEQPARADNGWLLNFNGTAGVWRKCAIEDARVGGWTCDTLTEDLDLSYRAQLGGWRIVYDESVVCPAELPAGIDALRSQQSRWAAGSAQCARKHLSSVWRSSLGWPAKIEATLHLTGYSVNLWMLAMALFGRPLLALVPEERSQALLSAGSAAIIAAAAAPTLAYLYARRRLGGRVSWLSVLALIAVGLGLCLNNAIAFGRGLGTTGGEFVRTPKKGRMHGASAYAACRSRIASLEVGLGLYCLAQWAWFLKADHYFGGTVLLLYAIGLLGVGGVSSRVFRSVRAVPTECISRDPALADAQP